MQSAGHFLSRIIIVNHVHVLLALVIGCRFSLGAFRRTKCMNCRHGVRIMFTYEWLRQL